MGFTQADVQIGDFETRPAPSLRQATNIKALGKGDTETWAIHPDHSRADPVFVPDDQGNILVHDRAQPLDHVTAQSGFRKVANADRTVRSIRVYAPRMKQH